MDEMWKRFKKWYFHERFSYFDVICIVVLANLITWFLSHLTWR